MAKPKLTAYEKRQLHNKKLLERRIDKAIKLLQISDSSAKETRSILYSRFTNKNAKGERVYQKNKLKQFDKVLRKEKTKKQQAKKPVARVKSILGLRAYQEMKKNILESGENFKAVIKDLNKKNDIYTLARNFSNPMIIYYYENKELILEYNKANKAKVKNWKRIDYLGNKLNENYEKYKLRSAEKVAENIAGRL